MGGEQLPDQITLRVARYRPEQEEEPTFDEYDVPLRKDWAYPVEYHGIPIIPPEGR